MSERIASNRGAGFEVALELKPWPPRAGGEVRWTFTVANISEERRALTFSSVQQGDVVLSRDGIERYRWSRDKFFAAVIAERELAPGEAVAFTLDDTLDVEPGTYHVLATVTARPPPPDLGTSLVVEP